MYVLYTSYFLLSVGEDKQDLQHMQHVYAQYCMHADVFVICGTDIVYLNVYVYDICSVHIIIIVVIFYSNCFT